LELLIQLARLNKKRSLFKPEKTVSQWQEMGMKGKIESAQ
jgi:hypothetical protein